MPRIHSTALTQLPFVSSIECPAVKRLPVGTDWSYELKLDGYRAQVLRETSGVRILSRNGNDMTARFPFTTGALRAALPIGDAVDGELVAFNAGGRPSFNSLQNAYGASTQVVFYAFDLLMLSGRPVMQESLSARREMLTYMYEASELADRSLPFPAENPDRFLAGVRAVHGEGVVAKHKGSIYEPGERTGQWRKLRINLAQEFVIGGYTRGSEPFDALLIGFMLKVVQNIAD